MLLNFKVNKEPGGHKSAYHSFLFSVNNHWCIWKNFWTLDSDFLSNLIINQMRALQNTLHIQTQSPIEILCIIFGRIWCSDWLQFHMFFIFIFIQNKLWRMNAGTEIIQLESADKIVFSKQPPRKPNKEWKTSTKTIHTCCCAFFRSSWACHKNKKQAYLLFKTEVKKMIGIQER